MGAVKLVDELVKYFYETKEVEVPNPLFKRLFVKYTQVYPPLPTAKSFSVLLDSFFVERRVRMTYKFLVKFRKYNIVVVSYPYWSS